ncbi:MAG: nucleotidyltransferase family protein [Verrucomicrobiae bacterium]|nr:nucleotidyltransferase family protein [Verrucomicrobiae bacterium]
MGSAQNLAPVSWSRMLRAVEKVRERLLRAARALESAGIPYAVVGGHAVAAHVSRVDEAAVRNTRDVDLLLRRSDLPAARHALELAGFHYRHLTGLGMPGGLEAFIDGSDGSIREAVHLVPAGENVRPDSLLASPDVTESEPGDQFRLVTLPALVRMKLVSFRDKDRTHLRDLLDLGLVDASWLAQLPDPLAARLRQLIENPE